MHNEAYLLYEKILGKDVTRKIIMLDFLCSVGRSPENLEEEQQLVKELERVGMFKSIDEVNHPLPKKLSNLLTECRNEKIEVGEETGIPLLYRIGKPPKDIEDVQQCIFAMDCLCANEPMDYEQDDDDDFWELQEEYEELRDRHMEELERLQECTEKVVQWVASMEETKVAPPEIRAYAKELCERYRDEE